jgi:hypothetical protein
MSESDTWTAEDYQVWVVLYDSHFLALFAFESDAKYYAALLLRPEAAEIRKALYTGWRNDES